MINYISYKNNKIEDKYKFIIQNGLSEIACFFNQKEDERLHIEKINWSYLNRYESEENKDTSILLIEKEAQPFVYAGICSPPFNIKEFDFFLKNKTDFVFFKPIVEIIEHDTNSYGFDAMFSHEVWHLIERQNNAGYFKVLGEGAATLASLLHIEEKYEKPNTVNEFTKNVKNKQMSSSTREDYIEPLMILAKYCHSFSDILDEDIREKATNELNDI